MLRFSLNLPSKYRLDLRLVKRRKNLVSHSLLPFLGKIRRIKKGSKISRFARYIFESKKLNRVLTTNLALIAITTSFIPSKNDVFANEEVQELAQSPIILTTEKSHLRYPVDNIKISQGYKFYHPAIDFDGVTGDYVYPIMKGKVEAIQYSRYGYGNAILVNHGGSISSLYAHLSKIFVGESQEVSTDTVIGTIGSTGLASGDHLHLEIRENGVPLNPELIFPSKLTNQVFEFLHKP